MFLINKKGVVSFYSLHDVRVPQRLKTDRAGFLGKVPFPHCVWWEVKEGGARWKLHKICLSISHITVAVKEGGGGVRNLKANVR